MGEGAMIKAGKIKTHFSISLIVSTKKGINTNSNSMNSINLINTERSLKSSYYLKIYLRKLLYHLEENFTH
jgi:hypothetical protein